jgi:hypothetical protein
VVRFLATRTGLRICVAVLAAYAVALQMVLASIVPVHIFSGDTSFAADLALCQGDRTVPHGAPAPSNQLDHCPPCIFNPAAGALPPVTASISVAPVAVGSVIPARAATALATIRHPTPRLSQGPPHSA